ncbi:hypothetical protein SAMN05216249_10753 [Acetitomaculum ruminis DSM 5522]|uniref:Uncharacterized protein n=1 Tax=Acetitomaculum ruminis DSM 5522 TaxID=1120918 RepID=A0A1I0XNS1_9FIRM|nr:hypothetical protein [Acetitomaculum ruminis]SFB02705.1 hypothetical protein SAMN05216249_10753 [Acetitomaculum ruminis DSM 5522]
MKEISIHNFKILFSILGMSMALNFCFEFLLKEKTGIIVMFTSAFIDTVT